MRGDEAMKAGARVIHSEVGRRSRTQGRKAASTFWRGKEWKRKGEDRFFSKYILKEEYSSADLLILVSKICFGLLNSGTIR